MEGQNGKRTTRQMERACVEKDPLVGKKIVSDGDMLGCDRSAALWLNLEVMGDQQGGSQWQPRSIPSCIGNGNYSTGEKPGSDESRWWSNGDDGLVVATSHSKEHIEHGC